MAPVINPEPCTTTADSWHAWGPCNHFSGKETTASTGLAEPPVADVSETRKLDDDRTLDQTACGDQGFSGTPGELKNDISTEDGQAQSSNVIIDSTAKEENGSLETQIATPNTVLSSNSEQNSVATGTGASTEHDCSADDVTTLPAKDSAHSERQAVLNTSSEKPVKDSCIKRKVSGCPECEKMRQQKEKPFLIKSKSCSKFVWNRYLLRGFEGAIHPDWIFTLLMDLWDNLIFVFMDGPYM
ncbi:hypothetical protein OS493_000039 [Desmophyllum pertusum]|uniref:Uncharacterized protein n=1 Tax=Desmophyllum pertusum TaxID=174260 RepID=A0A9X0A6H3_9CNID|nr:hypothetical protein OS493_000039 [Desmophyllum pertusum]